MTIVSIPAYILAALALVFVLEIVVLGLYSVELILMMVDDRKNKKEK